MQHSFASWSVSVTACPGGGVHVHFGPTTIHLTADQLRDLARTTARAIRALGEEPTARFTAQPH